jgi:two-component system, OmpR family, sensor kinase
MSRLPVRLRLTLAFGVAMAVVLSALGALLYSRVRHSLDQQLDAGLRVRAAALTDLVRDGRGRPLAERFTSADPDEFAQLLTADGTPLAVTDPQIAEPIISPTEASRTRGGAYLVHRRLLPHQPQDEAARLLVSPVQRDGRPLVLVVGAALEDVEDALDRLLTQLFVVGPAALVVSCLAGYLLAAAALRPVEVMRRRASEISHDRAGQRLPLPRARDELQRLGETLNAMLARLEGALARERRFVADASHELRTPLTLLRTELELALRRPRAAEELREALRSAADETERLTRLADDLLVLARVDEGGLPLHRGAMSSANLLSAVAGRFDARAAADGRTLTVHADEDPLVVGDRLRLEQALGNLVDNALRYGAGRVRLEAAQQDGWIELRVSDDGHGPPPEFLPRAFDRFTRAEAARGGGGTGLGLAIVEAIARSHGRAAGAGRREGGGADAWIELPGRG